MSPAGDFPEESGAGSFLPESFARDCTGPRACPFGARPAGRVDVEGDPPELALPAGQRLERGPGGGQHLISANNLAKAGGQITVKDAPGCLVSGNLTSGAKQGGAK